jgi:hypothetical protein
MRRYDRPALRFQSLKPIAQRSVGRQRTGMFALSDADMNSVASPMAGGDLSRA